MASARESIVLPYVMGAGPVEGNVTPVRPLWDGAASRLMPQITFGHRLRGAFAFMSADEVGQTAMQKTALANLLGVEASWTKTRIEGEDGKTHRALVCQDNTCATEKILDVAFMKEAQRLLGAKRLVVGLPVRSVMLAMDGDKDAPAVMGFLGFNLSLFRGGEGIPVTPALFRMVDGRFEGFFADGLEPFLDELEAGAKDEGDYDDQGEDEDEFDEEEGPTIVLATNAPETWPPVEVPEAALDDPVELGLSVMMALDDAFEDDVEDLGRPVFRMTENGFVELVNEVIEGDRRTGLLAYNQATPAAAAHFQGAREALREVGVEAVYYAPEPMPEARPAPVVVPFRPEMLMCLVGDPEPGSFATWWSVEGDESFLRSETYRCIERSYVALQGFEDAIFARIARAVEMVDPTKKGRISVPFEEQDAFVRGPDARPLLFSASAEKGLLFAFRMSDTPLEWRNTFWRHYAGAIEVLAAELNRNGAVRKAKEPLPLLGWLQTAARHNEEMELSPGETRVFRLAQVD